MSDRTVHAEAPRSEWQIVRYERAGKWYVEYAAKDLYPSRHIGVSEAARLAVQLEEDAGGRIHLGRAGGSYFDRRVVIERQKLSITEGDEPR